jgi:uncharacterized protein (DUF486 family)
MRAPEEPVRQALVDRRAGKLGHRAVRVPAAGSREPHRLLAVFVPFAFLYMKQPLKLDYLWASLCIMGAVYFIFRV